jgi:hypothetical protein
MINTLLTSEVRRVAGLAQQTLADGMLKRGWKLLYGSTTGSSYHQMLLYMNLLVLQSWIGDGSDINYITEAQMEQVVSKTEQLLKCGCSD